MERDPYNYFGDDPEKRWGASDTPEDEQKEQPPERKKRRWLFGETPDEEQPKKPKEEAKKPPEKPGNSSKERQPKTDPNIDPASPEFQELSTQQKKYVLAKREVRQRTEDLEVELAEAQPESDEAKQVIADLALVRAVDAKLDNPELDFSEQVEQTYTLIMDRLDEILGESDTALLPEDEVEPLIEPSLQDLPTPIDKPFRAKPPKRTAPTRSPQTRTKGTVSASPPQSGGRYTPPVSDRESATSSSVTAPEQVETRSEHQSTPSEVRQRRAGSLAVSEALTVMLSRRHEQEAADSEQNTGVNREFSQALSQRERAVRTAASETSARKYESSTNQIATPERQHVMEYAHTLEEPPVALEPIRIDTHESRVGHTTSAPLKEETQRNLSQASTEELLQIGSNIKLDGVNLRDLYNRNEIDRQGLSKIINEALKGGDIKRVFKKVRLGEEARRGRKIEMRHDDPRQLPYTDVATDTHSARTNQLLEALHAVQHTTNPSPDSGDHTIPSKQEVETAVTQQRRAAQISIAMITAAVVVTAALLFIFVF